MPDAPCRAKSKKKKNIRDLNKGSADWLSSIQERQRLHGLVSFKIKERDFVLEEINQRYSKILSETRQKDQT